jgi:hypothetical protein
LLISAGGRVVGVVERENRGFDRSVGPKYQS